MEVLGCTVAGATVKKSTCFDSKLVNAQCQPNQKTKHYRSKIYWISVLVGKWAKLRLVMLIQCEISFTANDK